MQPETVVSAPDVSATVAKIMSGEVFTALAVDSIDERAARLESVLARVVDDSTRAVWVGNPLRSPLTMERFLLQIVGPEIDLRVERGPAELARLIAGRVETEGRLLVVVQQPETINPETLEQLAALSGHLGGEAVQVQFLFVGSPALRLPDLARAPLGQLPALAPPLRDADRCEPALPRPRRRDVLPLILLLLATSLGAVFSVAAPMESESAAAHQVAELRTQFDSFLTEHAGSLPPLTSAQKDELFAEFISRRRRD